MSLYVKPQPLDIFVTMIIGIALGSILTTLYFYLVIKDKWERSWDYKRIKVIIKLSTLDNVSDYVATNTF
jgi:heme/copper-type cytochrome/quinol oxidase subunit 4